MSVDWQWEPLSPKDVAALFADAPAGWCVAGGWALDLFLGRQTRAHSDIDVQVPRTWLGDLHTLLPGWQLYAAEGTLTSWHVGEPFPESTTDIWCLRQGQVWELQLMLGRQTDHEWVYKRDDRIRGPLKSMIVPGGDDIPIMAPEIQLLYKAKLPNRPKDEADFRHTLPALSPHQRSWLAESLAIVMPGHPWQLVLEQGEFE